MSCEEIQVVLDEWARGGPVDAELSGPALAHAEGCAACGEYLEMSRALSRALGSWRDEQAALGAPPRVEKALMAAFRAKAGRSWRTPLVLGLGTAAAAALAAVVVIPRMGVTPSPSVVPSPVVTEAGLVAPLFLEPLGEEEAGEVVRVSLPASALHSMGFEVGEDVQGEDVEADVVLGADGVARAVQVVE